MVKNPRVFISYARSDGEGIAKELYGKLEDAGILCWMDRVKMKGGESWWQQIQEALNQVEFFVLVMTPGAIASKWTRKEWIYARQQGVCVFPVIAADNLDFDSLPRWMSKVHFYDLDHQWEKFVNDLNTRCEQPHIPFMVDDLPDIFIDRPAEYVQLVESLLDEKRENPKAITAATALKGAGGFGKTTLAIALCHDDEIQRAFSDGILWVTLGENPGNLVGKVSDLIIRLTGKNPGYTDLEAASDHLAELLADREMLLVIDDVWDSAHLRPFLRGGESCTRLITTRNSATLPFGTIPIDVDEMKTQEAVNLLESGLPDGDESAFQSLASRLGEWPLLLKLVNARLRERVHISRQSLDVTLTYINGALDKRGITAFDIQDSSERNSAVNVTLGLSLELLKGEESARFLELAIFPEDTDIPFETLTKYWGQTAGLDELDTEDLCGRFYRLSLLQQYNLATRTIKLHDVVRNYLLNKVGEEIVELHRTLLASCELEHWADLTVEEPYLWDHLTYHQVAAGNIEDLIRTVKDFQYLSKKTWLRKSYAVEIDLQRAVKVFPDDEELEVLYRNYRNAGHLLNRCHNLNDVSLNLLGRLSYIEKIERIIHGSEETIPPPHLLYYQHPPDLPHPALIRTLTGHTSYISSLVLSQDGGTIVSSGSDDNTVRIWDVEKGELRHILEGHTFPVFALALSQNGNMIVTGSGDYSVRVWDAQTGKLRHTLPGHTSGVISVVLGRNGSTVVSGSFDNTVRVWDAKKGELRYILEGHTGSVFTVALSQDGSTIVSGSEDGTVRVWDSRSGKLQYTLKGHAGWVNSVALSQDGSTIVSGSEDGTVRVWDAKSGKLQHTLESHMSGVQAVVLSQDDSIIVSCSTDKTLKVWDKKNGKLRHTLTGHTGSVYDVVISQDGDTIVSGSGDYSVRVWDTKSGKLQHTLKGHTYIVTAVALSQDGNMIVSGSEDKTVRIWDTKSKGLQYSLESYTSPVNTLAFSQDESMVVSGSEDGIVRVWDAKSGELQNIMEGQTESVNSVALSLDGGTIVSGSLDNSIRVWDAKSGKLRRTLKGHNGWVYSVVLGQDGNTIVSGSEDKSVRVWDAKSGKLRHTLKGHNGTVYSVVLSQDGNTIVSGSEDNSVRVWDARSGELRHTLKGHDSMVKTLALSQNGETLVSGSWETVRIWDTKSGDLRHTLKSHNSWVSEVMFSEDGGSIISGSQDGVVKIWNINSGELRYTLTLDSDSERLGAVALSQNGSTIVSGSDDGIVRVWDAKSGKYCCGIYTEGSIWVIKLSQNGNRIIVGGAGGLYFFNFVK